MVLELATVMVLECNGYGVESNGYGVCVCASPPSLTNVMTSVSCRYGVRV
jgi:hypothetical protein